MDKQRNINKKEIKKTMGLAASQARFLGLTARKASCEFQTTQLAQQKMQISQQLSEASFEYANSMNATKLVWDNDSLENVYGMTYSLLMMPSDANDYNPYLITSKTGAIVLNSRYAAAAQAAGISMGGGTGSQESRDKFISALADQGLVTKETAKAISVKDYELKDNEYKVSETDDKSGVNWNQVAGLGGMPINKNSVNVMTLADMITLDRIGGRTIDWLSVLNPQVNDTSGYYSKYSYNMKLSTFDAAISNIKNSYASNNTVVEIPSNISIDSHGTIIRGTSSDTTSSGVTQYKKETKYYYNDIANVYELAVKNDMASYENYKNAKEKYDSSANNEGSNPYEEEYIKAKKDWENSTTYKLFGQYLDITEAPTYNAVQYLPNQYTYETEYQTEVNEAGETVEILDAEGNKIPTGNVIKKPVLNPNYYIKEDARTTVEKSAAQAELERQKSANALHWAMFEKFKYQIDSNSKVISWDSPVTINGVSVPGPKLSDYFKTSDESYSGKLALVRNGSFDTNQGSIKDLTLGDLLSNDIAIYAYDCSDAAGKMSKWGEAILDQVASIFGLGSLGIGLNVDDASSEALAYAYNMVKRHVLKSGNAESNGNQYDINNPRLNSAYINATKYNRIGLSEDKNHVALDLTNMVSAFLTYYDQKLRGSDSVNDGYNVGRGIDLNESSKTYFVTDNPYYSYVLEGSQSITTEQRYADFYDELYNNICQYGWRKDDSVDHTDYLESAIKDGRYSMMALNNDGYYYQTRYNHTGYLKEVQDDDAITRAEAKYLQIKSDLAVKEDYIDIKNKNMDAEIAELNAEIESVKQLISKGIEKTFQMYSQ